MRIPKPLRIAGEIAIETFKLCGEVAAIAVFVLFIALFAITIGG